MQSLAFAGWVDAVGALRIHEGGLTATLYTSPRRLFEKLTSEFNSHLAVHQDQVARREVDFQAWCTPNRRT